MQPGPPPEPGSEKRILLAFVLTFVVIAVMQPLISRYVKPPEQPKQAQSASESPAATQPSSQSAAGAAQAAGEGARATPASSTPAQAKAAVRRGTTPAAPAPQ